VTAKKERRRGTSAWSKSLHWTVHVVPCMDITLIVMYFMSAKILWQCTRFDYVLGWTEQYKRACSESGSVGISIQIMNKWIICFELFVHCMCLVTDVWLVHTVVSFPLCFLYLNLLNTYKAMCCHLQCTFELSICLSRVKCWLVCLWYPTPWVGMW
jgi:hypothetical protein